MLQILINQPKLVWQNYDHAKLFRKGLNDWKIVRRAFEPAEV